MEVVRRGRGEKRGVHLGPATPMGISTAECLREGDLCHPRPVSPQLPEKDYNQDASSVMNAQLWNHQGPEGVCHDLPVGRPLGSQSSLVSKKWENGGCPEKPYISSWWTASWTRPVPLSLGGFSGKGLRWALALFASWEDCLPGRWTHLPAESKTPGLDPSAATDELCEMT